MYVEQAARRAARRGEGRSGTVLAGLADQQPAAVGVGAGAGAATGILRPSRVVMPQGGAVSQPGRLSETVGPAWMLTGHDSDGKTLSARLSETMMRRERYGVTVGRHDELCDVLIDHASLSRRHARFRLQGDRLMIEDLNSTNGTLLNGKPLKLFEPQPVDVGNLIVMGDLQFTLSRA
jgi:hypothetical protein